MQTPIALWNETSKLDDGSFCAGGNQTDRPQPKAPKDPKARLSQRCSVRSKPAETPKIKLPDAELKKLRSDKSSTRNGSKTNTPTTDLSSKPKGSLFTGSSTSNLRLLTSGARKSKPTNGTNTQIGSRTSTRDQISSKIDKNWPTTSRFLLNNTLDGSHCGPRGDKVLIGKLKRVNVSKGKGLHGKPSDGKE
jgi:hypothetical protein